MSSTASSWWSGKESLLPWLPKPIKLLIFLVFLFNIKSWPFVWHFKVWYPAIVAQIRARFIGLGSYYRRLKIGVFHQTPAVNGKAKHAIGHVSESAEVPETVLKLGRSHKYEHPFGVKSVKKRNAGFDDCDYNCHLSNSAYAKNLDASRMEACIELFSPMFAPGGWMALGAAHYEFIKEIPMFSDYEIHVSIAGFEDKWLYLIAEYITYPKEGSQKRSSLKKSRSRNASHARLQNAAATSSAAAPSANETTDNEEPGTGYSTAADTKPSVIEPTDLLKVSTDNNSTTPGLTPETLRESIKERISRDVVGKQREDGAVLNCFAVSTYCFKVGRITIPPRVGLSFCGYGDPSNWERAEKLLMTTKDHGKKWLSGGWKEDDKKKTIGEEWVGKKADEVFLRGRLEGSKLKEGLEGLRGVVSSVKKI